MRYLLIELAGGLCLCIDDAEYLLELRHTECASTSKTFAQYTHDFQRCPGSTIQYSEANGIFRVSSF